MTSQRPRYPRRIALVTHGYSTGGGVPTVARWLRAGLEERGDYSVDVHNLAASSRDRLSRRIAKPATWRKRSLQAALDKQDRVQHWGANAVEVEFMRYRPRAELDRILRSYDLVQVVAGSPALAAAAVGTGVPVVLQTATCVSWERASQPPAHHLGAAIWREAMTRATARTERLALRGVDVVMVENSAMLEFVHSAGQDNVVKAPPGVDTDYFRPATDGWRSGGYLLSVCRLGDARKGLSRMVRAYKALADMNERTPHLILAGRGALTSDVNGLIVAMRLEGRITVLADVSRDDLPELYRGASVYLQTSFEEGLGMSVLEAMASGIPVVSTNTAGTRESVVQGETGWLVGQDHEGSLPRAFANRVTQVLQRQGPLMSVSARARSVDQFSESVTLSRFTDVYDLILGNSRDKAAALGASRHVSMEGGMHGRVDPDPRTR